MTKGKSTLIPNEPFKGTAPKKQLTHNVPTDYVKNTNGKNYKIHGIFPDEQKGCCKRTRGTEELLYIDQHILNETKTKKKI